MSFPDAPPPTPRGLLGRAHPARRHAVEVPPRPLLLLSLPLPRWRTTGGAFRTVTCHRHLLGGVSEQVATSLPGLFIFSRSLSGRLWVWTRSLARRLSHAYSPPGPGESLRFLGGVPRRKEVPSSRAWRAGSTSQTSRLWCCIRTLAARPAVASTLSCVFPPFHVPAAIRSESTSAKRTASASNSFPWPRDRQPFRLGLLEKRPFSMSGLVPLPRSPDFRHVGLFLGASFCSTHVPVSLPCQGRTVLIPVASQFVLKSGGSVLRAGLSAHTESVCPQRDSAGG